MIKRPSRPTTSLHLSWLCLARDTVANIKSFITANVRRRDELSEILEAIGGLVNGARVTLRREP